MMMKSTKFDVRILSGMQRGPNHGDDALVVVLKSMGFGSLRCGAVPAFDRKSTTCPTGMPA